MKSNGIKGDLESRVANRVQKLKSGVAKSAAIKDPSLPERMQLDDKKEIETKIKSLGKAFTEIELLLESIQNFLPPIWEQTPEIAAYLLISKATSNLESLFILARNGKSLELVDLARSGMESLDLAFLFLEEGQEERLNKWFKGKIIKNEKSRKQLHKAINSNTASEFPVKNLTTDIYSTYSLYTHSSYAAILDVVDVFNETYDFKRYAGFHYTLTYIHLIQNLAINILFRLKMLFFRFSDISSVKKINSLLTEIEYQDIDMDSINKLLKTYGYSV